MDDYIKREDAERMVAGMKSADGLSAVKALGVIPSTDVAPVRHAEWLSKAMRIMCSDCGAEFNDEIAYMLNNYEPMNYCPACGAKMDGGEE